MLSDSQKRWFLVVSCSIWYHPKCFTSYQLRDPFDIIILHFIWHTYPIWYHLPCFGSYYQCAQFDIIHPASIHTTHVIHLISFSPCSSFHHPLWFTSYQPRDPLHFIIVLQFLSQYSFILYLTAHHFMCVIWCHFRAY